MLSFRRSRTAPAPGQLRALSIGLALGGVGALGALPARSGAADSLALLTWLALIAAPAGYVYGAARADLLRFGAVAPACWMVTLALADAANPTGLATPVWAAAVATGLFFTGAALGRLGSAAMWTGAGALLLFASLLSGLAVRGGAWSVPWPARTAALLLDVSPVTLVCESAGVRDWMWRAGVYEPAGVDRLARRPWRGSLAGPTLLVVGCALAACFSRIGRRNASGEEQG